MEESIDLRELFELFRRNLLFIISVTLIAAIAGLIISTFFMTPVYEASATMIVNKSENNNTDVTYNDLLLSQKLVKTYSVIMQSNTVLNRVIDEIGLKMSTGALKGMLSINGVNDTEVIKITVTNENPDLAAAIANEITKQAPAEIIRAVKAGSVEVIDSAVVPSAPVKPRKAMNTAIAGILGGMLSVGIIFLRNYFDDTIKTEEDIREKLNLPVLGVLPKYRSEDASPSQRKRGAGNV